MHTYSHIICVHLTSVYKYFYKNDTMRLFYGEYMRFSFENLQHRCCALLFHRIQWSRVALFPEARQIQSPSPAFKCKDSHSLVNAPSSLPLVLPNCEVITLCLPDTIQWWQVLKTRKINKQNPLWNSEEQILPSWKHSCLLQLSGLYKNKITLQSFSGLILLLKSH